MNENEEGQVDDTRNQIDGGQEDIDSLELPDIPVAQESWRERWSARAKEFKRKFKGEVDPNQERQLEEEDQTFKEQAADVMAAIKKDGLYKSAGLVLNVHSSVFGYKILYDLPAYVAQKGGSFLDRRAVTEGLKVAERLAAKERLDRTEALELKRKILRKRIDKTKRLSESEKEKLYERVDRIVTNYDRKDTSLREQGDNEITELLEHTIKSRITNARLLKESINTVMVAKGWQGARVGVYAATALYERYAQISEEMEWSEAGRKPADSKLRSVFVDGVLDTFKKMNPATTDVETKRLRMKTLKEGGRDIASVLPTVLRGVGIYSMGAEEFADGLDKLSEGIANFGQVDVGVLDSDAIKEGLVDVEGKIGEVYDDTMESVEGHGVVKGAITAGGKELEDNALQGAKNILMDAAKAPFKNLAEGWKQTTDGVLDTIIPEAKAAVSIDPPETEQLDMGEGEISKVGVESLSDADTETLQTPEETIDYSPAKRATGMMSKDTGHNSIPKVLEEQLEANPSGSGYEGDADDEAAIDTLAKDNDVSEKTSGSKAKPDHATEPEHKAQSRNANLDNDTIEETPTKTIERNALGRGTFKGELGKVKFIYASDGSVEDTFVPQWWAKSPKSEEIDAAFDTWGLDPDDVKSDLIDKRGGWEPGTRGTAGGSLTMPVDRGPAEYGSSQDYVKHKTGLDYSARGEYERMTDRMVRYSRQTQLLAEMRANGLGNTPEYKHFSDETRQLGDFISEEYKIERLP